MPSFDTTVAFLAGAVVVIAVPGPSVLFVLGRAVTRGRRCALTTTAGNFVGVSVLAVAVSCGAGLLVDRAPYARTIVTDVGAAYLVWLGVQAFRHRRRLEEDWRGLDDGGSGTRGFRDGLVFGLTNPKAAAFLVAFPPQFVDPAAGRPVTQVLALGLISCILASSVDAVWASAGGAARDWFASSPVRLRALAATGGVVMIGMGVGLAVTGHGS